MKLCIAKLGRSALCSQDNHVKWDQVLVRRSSAAPTGTLGPASPLNIWAISQSRTLSSTTRPARSASTSPHAPKSSEVIKIFTWTHEVRLVMIVVGGKETELCQQLSLLVRLPFPVLCYMLCYCKFQLTSYVCLRYFCYFSKWICLRPSGSEF